MITRVAASRLGRARHSTIPATRPASSNPLDIPIQAIEMRELHAAGWSTVALAEKFMVGRSTVYRVVSGRGWQHLIGDWVPASLYATSGEHHPNAKLNPLKVQEIRRLRQSGEKLAILAQRFGVTPQTISSIVKNKTWRLAEAA